jgi:hypothetical protein
MPMAPTLAIARLSPFIGTWSMDASFPDAPPTGPLGRTVFEWLPGEQFLIQRWEISHPDAPDGIAIIGLDADGGAYFQHYYDSRGVARAYTMTFTDGIWELLRESPDFSALDFAQRFTGRFTDGGDVIRGAWEISTDGSAWRHDFELTYTRVPS